MGAILKTKVLVELSFVVEHDTKKALNDALNELRNRDALFGSSCWSDGDSYSIDAGPEHRKAKVTIVKRKASK